jgi:AmmeMemoRadiSam system protein A/AmmeMemoRadiSam system protein B
MSSIIGAFIFPHPPIIVAEVGKGHERMAQATINAAQEAARRIAALKPETILIITPHGNMLSDALTIRGDARLYGSFASFGAPQVKLEQDNDLELVEEILNRLAHSDIIAISLDKEIRKTYQFEDEIDHGALVPLYFIHKQYQSFKLVHINYSMLPHQDHYRFGMIIRQAIEKLNRNTIILCSGDLSHRLTKDAPAGYNPKGRKFDEQYVDVIKQGDVNRLLNMDCDLTEGAGECGLRSTVITYGILDGCSPKGEILSYEGPFGVGYCVAQLHLDCDKGIGESSEILERYINEKKRKLEEIRKNEDPYAALARLALESYIKENKRPSMPNNLPQEMLQNKAGVFVSLKKHGELRGCIGTISPTADSIAQEIVQNAVSAGTGDPRFYPVEKNELEELQYSVDVLMKPEAIESVNQLDVRKYGVIVRSSYKSGLLLPNLEGVDTVEEQLGIVLQKAGILKGESYSMERFEVIRHK